MQHPEFPIAILVTPTTSLKRIVKVRARDHKGVFRLFVQARDGQWYKQHDPQIGRHGRGLVLCTFGVEEAPSGSVYRIIAIAGDTTIPEVIQDISPRTLLKCQLTQLSEVVEVVRA